MQRLSGNIYSAYQVRNEHFSWAQIPVLDSPFLNLVAHGYKDYYYYTGSGFKAARQTRLQAAILKTESFFVRAVMKEERMEQMLNASGKKVNIIGDPSDISGHISTEDDFFWHDHLTINLLASNGHNFSFAVNPAGEMRCLRDNRPWKEAVFHAEASYGNDNWEAIFHIPLASLFDNCEILGFDAVRFEQLTAEISSLSPVNLAPPYNNIFDYPVFAFSSLELAAGQDTATLMNRSNPLDGFKAEIVSPNGLICGSCGQVKLEFTIGAAGMSPGGGLRIMLASPGIDTAQLWTRPRGWGKIQNSNAAAPGFFSVEPAGLFEENSDGQHIFLRLPPGTSIEAETKFTVSIGERGPGIKISEIAAADHRALIAVDPFGHGIYEELEISGNIMVRNREAVALLLSIPGAVPGDSTFELCVRVVDVFGNLDEDFCGTVDLSWNTENHTFPRQVEFTSKDKGGKIVRGAILDQGVFFALASYSGISAESNFIATDGSFGTGWILYGDVHCHTNLSDGVESPEERLRKNRYLRGLQFTALSDHDFDMKPDTWPQYQQYTGNWHKEHSFVVFNAYEWTPSGGRGMPLIHNPQEHYVVLFKDKSVKLNSSMSKEFETPQQLLENCRKDTEVTLIAHYHGTRGPVDAETCSALEIAAWDGKESESGSPTCGF